MSTRVSKLLQRTIKENKEWLSERPPILEQQFAFLDESLRDPTLQGLGGATVTLDVLATYFGRKGTIRVIDGDSGGWQEIHKSVAYHFWCLKIDARSFFKTVFLKPIEGVWSLDRRISMAACLHCHYLAIGDQVREHYTFDILKAVATVPRAVDEPYWQARVFEPFVLRLQEKRQGTDRPDVLVQQDLGPYEKVLEHWDTSGPLADAIHDICDYHCTKLEDLGGDWNPEFDRAPFDLLPSEILAIYAIRQSLGLATPKVEHPLLMTPLMNIAPDPKAGMDEILARVEAVYSDVFGSVE